ncbi:MAG TPA: DUF5063 domain-containing protein [Candidatus Gallibacteroides avistercoris]|uniref:DUF5063 domain-containing protein n=1 Tax=Candidatus Gallibacteroides avistercoris TaxID=2840833 RepID=A0A9D1M8V2_9BACT|nr:DUF5063 domain-containing protein [Candidatus Gallibacteroides avistercoris]
MNQIIYHKNTIEFVTVAVEFCSFIEQALSSEKKKFTDTAVKILPFLYLKGCLLPECEEPEEVYISEKFVTEEIYELIRNRIASLLGSQDSYLEVFVSDMQYSDTPIVAYISEDLTDIYQDIKDFVSIYRIGIEEQMYEALYNCRTNFKNYWGQKITNVLRPLHGIAFSPDNEEETSNASSPNIPDNTRSILEQRMEEWKDEPDLDHWHE